MYSPGDYENIILGLVLRFGKEAALAVLPELTADKFVCDITGSLGREDHKHIWRAIEQVTLVESSDPAYATGAIKRHLSDNLYDLAAGYANELTYKYRIDQFDVATIRNMARQVHKQGVVYSLARAGYKLGRLTEPDLFAKYITKVEDAEQWSGEILAEMSLAGGDPGDSRYVHVSEISETTKDRMKQQRRGEQTFLLPTGGFPPHTNFGLFPAESMALVHGLSSGGKSTYVQNVVCLGTAIGMVHSGVKGCVAINSLEMDRQAFITRAAASLAGFDVFKFTKNPQSVSDLEFDWFLEYIDFVGKLPIWVDDTPGINVETLHMRLMGVHLSPHGPIRLLTTDYLELFDGGSDDSNVEQKLSAITAAHFKWKRDLQTCVIAVSQSTYTNKTYVAGMYGARYSRALTHKPDIILELVNYAALKASGTDYIVAPGLDEDHVWLLLQKYRGGKTEARIQLGWEPEYTRMYDPGGLGLDGSVVIFDQLQEVRTLLKDHPTTTIIPFGDTPLAHINIEGDF